MKPLDVFLLLLLAWGGYSGFKKGLLLEIFSVGALVLATLGSTRLADGATELYARWYQQPSDSLSYSLFMLLFVTLFVATMFVGKFFKALIKPTLLGNLDRLLGSGLGLLKWAVCSSICIWLGEQIQLKIPNVYTDHTTLFPIIASLTPQLLAWGTTWWPHLQEHLCPVVTSPTPLDASLNNPFFMLYAMVLPSSHVEE